MTRPPDAPISPIAPPVPAAAAAVILLRPAASGFEVLLLRRRRGASFMASAWVFPGGAAEPSDGDVRVTAARELAEEAGVRLTSSADEWDPGALHFWAHWITPSIEARRFSAQFFVALMPAGQTAQCDQQETVDLRWLTPADALALAHRRELRLPPPQLRTLWELSAIASLDEVFAAAARRQQEPHPILPRAGSDPHPLCLLLPWDPEYLAGSGELLAMTPPPRWATGPGRFILEEETWTLVSAPASPTTGS
jgi:8-oxo-dGTP pyrophosphatase MutT (NUDIX family)